MIEDARLRLSRLNAGENLSTLLSSLLNYISPREVLHNGARLLAVYLAIVLFNTFTSPNPKSLTYPLSVMQLNNSTLSFETILLLSPKPAFKKQDTVYFSLPPYENGILHAPSSLNGKGEEEGKGLLHATPMQTEPGAPKRKGHTAALTRIVERGYSTALIFEDKIGVNARFREELYAVHRALLARPRYEDMQLSELHKLKGYWDEPDAMIPIGPQPTYAPYYRAAPSVDIGVDEYAIERLISGKGLGGVPQRDEKEVGQWDLLFLGDCREGWDEEAQKKLRSKNKERTPWRRVDWVVEPGQASGLWVPERTEVDVLYERKLREKKREEGKVGEKEMLGQGLRRVDGPQDACILAYAVSRRGALKLQKHFGASDPTLGTQDLMARFCGGDENVCFVLGEGVVRERRE
ncbi:uncharacterized protein HMPREF1541_08281 [Cyphellophora europaea CBS 101466]|uniref:Uncharacterized protein n=1 Tax=Cyphellophora europaea (strain CBS 101466) TaxID=1220924 RepID=W2RLV0_CYPE1|nr:uncharacterized protein HMPREF1541_08281 [Cyphellophora europaea CBS 101466]ETN37290.1 hypothetical protein HMPREF1541_08281 [Cyphellophora europaea CBS 101466]